MIRGQQENKRCLKSIEYLIILLYTSASAHKSALNRLAAYIHMQKQTKMAFSGENGHDQVVNVYVTVCKLGTKEGKSLMKYCKSNAMLSMSD